VYVLPTSRLGNLALMAPRPNQAVDRGIYYSPHHTTTRSLFNTGLRGLGQEDLTVNWPLLAGGAAALLLAFYLIGGRKGGSKGRKLERLGARRQKITDQMKALGAS
jgi:hypothetical protein